MAVLPFPARNLRTDLGKLLELSIDEIIRQWSSEVRRTITPAAGLSDKELSNNLPAILRHMAERLSVDKPQPAPQELVVACRAHGTQRTRIPGYSLEEVIKEYRLLRRVIFRVLGGSEALSGRDLDLILDSIGTGIIEAATEFAYSSGLENARASQRQSEHFLDSLVENIPDMIFVKDAKELRFVRFNRAGENLIGLSRDELLGKNDYDFFPKEQADFFTKKDREVLAGKTAVDIPEEKLTSRTHGVRLLHTKKIPIFDEQGSAKYLLGISEDITERTETERQRGRFFFEQAARKQAERHRSELEKALQARDQFISSASHELKTPLTTLKLQAQIIKHYLHEKDAQFLQSPRFLSLVDSTDDEIRRIEGLVSDMLDVSRIRLGRLVLNPERESLRIIVSDAIARLRQVSDQDIPITMAANGDVFGWFDRYRVGQVVTNLLTNALKYGQGKPVEVRVSSEEGKARLEVIDHGLGIAKENQKRIFERFERISSSKSITGLGIGLFISREIVKAHGGSIWVESEEGKGSRFVMELPLGAST